MSQLDGSDIVYTARAPVAKIIALVGAHRHSVPRGRHVDGPRAAGRPAAGRAGRGARDPVAVGHHPARHADAGRAGRRAGRDPRARLGGRRRAAVGWHPLGRRARQGPRRTNRGRHERHRVRRRHVDPEADRCVPSTAPRSRQGDVGGVGTSGVASPVATQRSRARGARCPPALTGTSCCRCGRRPANASASRARRPAARWRCRPPAARRR